jgi:predicted DNA-binding protein YlxM (UPF0122 family)
MMPMFNAQMKTWMAIISILFISCQSFIPTPQTLLSNKRTSKLFASNAYSQALKRRNVQIPLLDIQDDDSIIIPLPAAHLPNEITTLQIYGTQLNSAIHKMMIQDTLSKVQPLNTQDLFSVREEPIYGHVVSKPDDGSLVGAIGCAAEIVLATPSAAMQIQSIDEDFEPLKDSDADDDGIGSGEAPMTVLARGSFRFVVKEVTQTFPFPIVIVDELLDDEPVESAPIEYSDFEDTYDNEEDDDEDTDEDMYANIDSSDLIQRTLRAMKAIVDQKLSTKPKTMSPLEQIILKDSGMDSDMNRAAIENEQNEEMAAIFDVFVSSLIDIAPSRIERLYSVGMMAAEFSGVDNKIRKEALEMVDGVARLRLVLKEAEKKISMVQAKQITEQIVDQSDTDSKDLQVGSPSLPPWAKQIKKGTKIEYFWNEAEGWCKGTVTEDPVLVVDELIITVQFDDDETHRLPFQGDEKARWRPDGMS